MAQLDLVAVGPEQINGPPNAKIMNHVEKHHHRRHSANDQVPEQIMLHFPTEIGANLY